jgi:hypothetical protein
MSSYVVRTLVAISRLAAAAGRAARRVGAAFAELNRVKARHTEVWLGQDVYGTHPAAVPGTYEEFLFRTRGSLAHEPSLRARLDGHPVH